MKKINLIVLVILMAVLTACNSNLTSYEDTKSQTSGMLKEDVIVEENLENVHNQKIIVSKSIMLETLNFEKTITKIEEITLSLNGYVQGSNISNASIRDNFQNSRYASYSLKIPKDKCDIFEENIKKEGNILNSSTDSVDVSSEYRDTQKRIDALKVREDKIVELISKADNISDVIKLEEELSKVIYERETMQGNLNQIDKDVDYISVYVEVMEVNQYNTSIGVGDSFVDKVLGRFKGGINNAIVLFENIILLFIGLIPVIVVFSPVIIIVYYVINKNKNKKIRNNKKL